MASFTITGPDQQSVTINAPDGAPPEQIQAKVAQVKANWKPQDNGQLSWADVPGQALSNAPASALHAAKTMVYPFMHPVDTAKSLFDIGYGGASKLAGYAGVAQTPDEKASDEAQINAVGQFFKDRYGSSEGIKKTLSTDPVGGAMDAAMVLMGGGGALARAPGALGKVGETAKAVGSAIDPISNTGRLASNLATGSGKAAANILGMTTGAGSTPIETAYQAGKAGSGVFTDHMRGQAPMSDVGDLAQSAKSQIIKDRGEAYKTSMAGMKENDPLMWGAKTTPVQPVYDALNEAGKAVYFRGVPKSMEADKVLHQIADKVDEFGKVQDGPHRSAEAMDAMKQSIGEIRMKTQPGTLERRVADQVYNATKSQIVAAFPEYAKTMKEYSQASDQIDDITRTFSLGDKASKDTALRKLTSVMRNNVNTNYGQRAKIMDIMAVKEPDLPNAIAGQALNSLSPRGMSSLPALGSGIAAAMTHNPALLLGLPASSPRIVGELSYGAGQAAGHVNALAKYAPSSRAFHNALMTGYGAGVLTNRQ